ncbi:MAG TPA: hypothetical protein VF048_13925 [Gemmatimonadaceae bacterium]
MASPPTHPPTTSDYDADHREARQFYRDVLLTLREGAVPFLVGGAYAYARFTGIKRPTKDFDIFVRPEDVERALAVLADAGFTTELTFPHWLAKAGRGLNFVDIIFSSGNGIARVDDGWFEHGVPGEVFALNVLLTPAEEMLWSKAFVMERERYDGADVIHLLHARGPHMDWDRLLRRFGPHWRVLFVNLVLYGFVYPGDPLPCPKAVMDELQRRLAEELTQEPSRDRLCRGPILSREQYLTDTLDRGYSDGRQLPHGTMTEDEIRRWTAAITSRK